CAGREREFGDVISACRFDYKEQIAFAGGQINLFDLDTQFLSEFLCGLAPLRSVLDRANSLFGPVQRQNKRRHVILHWFTKVFPCVAAAARAYDNVASCPASCKVNRQVRSMGPFTLTIARRYPSRRQGSQPSSRPCRWDSDSALSPGGLRGSPSHHFLRRGRRRPEPRYLASAPS